MLRKYGADNSNLIISGIPIQEFGDTDPAIQIEDLEPRAALKLGVGRTSLRLDNVRRAKRLTVNLMPGSAEVRQLIALDKSGADVTFSFTQTGTDERVVGFDGIVLNRGSQGRAGKTNVTDEQFIFVFADSDES